MGLNVQLQAPAALMATKFPALRIKQQAGELLDLHEKKKVSCIYQESYHDSLSIRPLAVQLLCKFPLYNKTIDNERS